MNIGSYFFSDKIALSMYGAKPVSREEAPRLYQMVEYLCSRAGMPMPKLYLIPSDSPNAFATGRNPEHASVAVTQGALRILDENELQGVLAHEISHVKNRDILISSIAATLAGAIMWIAHMARFAAFFGGGRDREEGGGGALGGLMTMILAPIAALLIQMWISRTREYQADASGARGCRKPLRPCVGPAEARKLFQAPSHGRLAFYGPYVHRPSVFGTFDAEPLQHAPTLAETNRKTLGKIPGMTRSGNPTMKSSDSRSDSSGTEQPAEFRVVDKRHFADPDNAPSQASGRREAAVPVGRSRNSWPSCPKPNVVSTKRESRSTPRSEK